MRILIAHVRYRDAGGEEAVVAREAKLLADSGHDVRVLETQAGTGASGALRDARSSLALASSYGAALVRDAVHEHQPAIVHFHNMMPALGAEAVREARGLGCGVVRTIHNFRYSCLAGTHSRDGRDCESCSAGRYGPGIVRGCYRRSRVQSSVIAAGTRRLWEDAVAGRGPHLHLAVTERMRERFVSAGLPPGAVVVKPNSAGRAEVLPFERRAGAVYVGRLSPEKGVDALVRAWTGGGEPLTVVGDGPLAPHLASLVGSGVHLAGRVPADEAERRIATARVLVLPSRCAEGLPVVFVEALSAGTPVVTFDSVGVSDVVAGADRRLVVPQGDFSALASIASDVCRMSRSEWNGLSERVHGQYERSYAPEADVRGLETAYARALSLRG